MKRWLVLAAACLGGCALFLPKTLRDLPPVHPGDHLVAKEDTAMQQIKGETVEKLPYRQLLLGSRGSVVPVGTELEVISLEEQTSGPPRPAAPLAQYHPWVLVKVTASSQDKMIGWQGWVHRATLQDAALAPHPQPAPFDAKIRANSRVCKHADSDDHFCTVLVAGGTPVRVLEPGPQKTLVELWDSTGFYEEGYVNTTQIQKGAL
jgi:hypothetical protein